MGLLERTRGIVGSSLLLAGLASPAVAQDMDSPKAGEGRMTVERGTEKSPDQLRQVTLRVKEVMPEENKVTFEAEVRPEAGGTTQLQRLEEGQRVRASFDPETGEVVKLEVIGSTAK